MNKYDKMSAIDLTVFYQQAKEDFLGAHLVANGTKMRTQLFFYSIHWNS